MMRQIEIHGQRFELYSPDDGRTWSSSPQSIVAYRRRNRRLRLELQKRFELMRDRAPISRTQDFNERSTAMSGKTDQIKGRVKEAAGALTDNERLKREGKVDQAVGKVKDAAEKVVDKVKKVTEKAVDKVKDA